MANALTGNFGPLAALDYVQQQGEIGRQRGQQNRLNQLAGQSYSATTPQDQSSLLGQMAAINPQAAQAQQQQFQGQEDRNRKLVYNAARYLKGALDRQNPAEIAGAWRAVRPGLINAGLATEQELSPEWQPDYAQTVHQALAMGGDGSSGSTTQNKVVGGALVTPDGQVVYEAPVNGQVVDVPDGMGGSNKMVFDPRTRSLSPLSGAAAARPASGTGPDGTPFVIGADLSPEQVAAAQRDIASGGSIDQVQLPDRGAAGSRLGYTPPKPRDAPAGYNYVGDTLTPIPGGPADNTSPQAQATGEQGLRKEVSNLLKQDQSILSMYRNVQATSRNPSAAGDLSMIFAFMKMLDPGSVVREQEFANAQNAAGVPDQVVNAYNRALSGQRLNPRQRGDFLRQAAQLAGEAENRITSTTRQYQDIARQYGYDPVRGTGMADFSGVSSSSESTQTPRGSEAPRSSNIDALLEKYR